MLKQISLEERWNVYTHALGALLSWVGMYVIFTTSVITSFEVQIGVFVYLLSVFFLFSASVIYHSRPPAQQPFWQKIDHIAIFFLIAGTYTPVTLTLLLPTSGIYLLVAVWGIAFLGVLYKLFYIGKHKNFSLFLYLLMGWLVVADFQNVYALFPKDAFLFLALGGGFYTVGTLFYRWESLYFHHVIWHVFVLAGAFSHFIMVYKIIGA